MWQCLSSSPRAARARGTFAAAVIAQPAPSCCFFTPAAGIGFAARWQVIQGRCRFQAQYGADGFMQYAPATGSGISRSVVRSSVCKARSYQKLAVQSAALALRHFFCQHGSSLRLLQRHHLCHDAKRMTPDFQRTGIITGTPRHSITYISTSSCCAPPAASTPSAQSGNNISAAAPPGFPPHRAD